MGDHVYKKEDIISALGRSEPILRPANFPADAPGRDHVLVEAARRDRRSPSSPSSAGPTCGRSTARSRPPTASWARLPPDVQCVLVDVHAEATSDKQLLGRHLDGRVSAVLGTHTHVATADEQIFPEGTAFRPTSA